MSDQQNYENIRTKALFEAVRLCDSEKNLALKINVSQPTISKWINNPEITIAYNLGLKIEKTTKVHITRLIPNQPEINNYLKERISDMPLLTEINKNTIITTNSVSLPFLQPNRFVIIGTDRVLISGLQILNNHSAIKIPVLILDLAAILSKATSLDNIIHQLLISERIAIGLRLEQLIGNRNGQKNTKNNNINKQLNGVYYQIIGRTYAFIASIFQFSKNNYIKARQVYLSYNEHLINAIDNKSMSIHKAREQLNINNHHK